VHFDYKREKKIINKKFWGKNFTGYIFSVGWLERNTKMMRSWVRIIAFGVLILDFITLIWWNGETTRSDQIHGEEPTDDEMHRRLLELGGKELTGKGDKKR
jgi:hypothetical protein